MLGHRCCLSLCCALAASGLLAGETDWDPEIGLNTGYDSNPLKLPVNERGGGFTELVFDGELKTDLSERNEFHLDLEAEARRYGSSLSDADTTRAEIEAGLELAPYAKNLTVVRLEFGARLAARRGTFTSRSTGRVFEVDDGNGGSVAIPDRFDYNRLEAFANLEWRPSLRARLFLETEYTLKDYVEDYDGIASVESLDYGSTFFRPGVRFGAGRTLDLELSAVRTDRDYDERMAVDGTGAEVPGTTREYVYSGFETKLRLRPESRWSWTFGLEVLDREDMYVGYYDYSSWTMRAIGRVHLGVRDRLRLYASLNDREYDNSTVNSEIDGELRASETLKLRAAYTRELTRRFELTVEAGLRSVENSNSLYEYDRSSLAVWLGYN